MLDLIPRQSSGRRTLHPLACQLARFERRIGDGDRHVLEAYLRAHRVAVRHLGLAVVAVPTVDLDRAAALQEHQTSSPGALHCGRRIYC